MLRWTEISNQTTLQWPTLRGCFCTLLWVIIHFHSESLFSLFCSVCLKLRRKSRISPATSITSLIKSSGSVSLEAIHCLHHVWQMMSFFSASLYCYLPIISSHPLTLPLSSSVQRFLSFPELCRLFRQNLVRKVNSNLSLLAVICALLCFWAAQCIHSFQYGPDCWFGPTPKLFSLFLIGSSSISSLMMVFFTRVDISLDLY